MKINHRLRNATQSRNQKKMEPQITHRGLRPQPKKMEPQITQITQIKKNFMIEKLGRWEKTRKLCAF